MLRPTLQRGRAHLREIAVFNVDGEYVAAANHCVRAGGPVCEGDPD